MDLILGFNASGSGSSPGVFNPNDFGVMGVRQACNQNNASVIKTPVAKIKWLGWTSSPKAVNGQNGLVYASFKTGSDQNTGRSSTNQ